MLLALRTVSIIPQIALRTRQSNNEKLTNYRELNPLCFLEICVNRLKKIRASHRQLSTKQRGRERAMGSLASGWSMLLIHSQWGVALASLPCHSPSPVDSDCALMVWVRPEERADLVMCLKDMFLLKMAEGKLSRRRDIHADKRQRAGPKRRLSILLIIQTQRIWGRQCKKDPEWERGKEQELRNWHWGLV